MSNAEELLQTARTLLSQWATDAVTPEPNRLDIALAAGDLLPAVSALHGAHWGYLAAITGLDLGMDKNQIEILYQFCAGPIVLTLRVCVPYEAASVPSVCGIVPSASFLERELIEMFGVQVEGTPNTDHLFLPDNWPEGVYPLRKSFVFERKPQ